MKNLITYLSKKSLSLENGSGMVQKRLGNGSGMVRDRFEIGSAKSRKWFGNGSGMTRKWFEIGSVYSRLSLGSNLSRFCLASLICLCMLTVGVGKAWGAKITDYKNIVSGTEYYIGATTSKTDYYWKASQTTTGTSLSGTAVTSKDNATIVILEGSGTSWKIKIKGTSNYVTLANSKANGKFNIATSSNNWTFSNVNSLIKMLYTKSYCLQKNTSGTQFGSYGGTQTNVWLEEAAAAFTVTASSNNNSWGTVSVTGTTITATPNSGYRVMSGTDGYTVTSGTATVVNNGDNTFTVTPSSNCTVQINFEADQQYTVNWYVNGSIAHSQTGYEGATLTGIPTPTSSDCDGSKVFVGWYTSTYSHASDAPAYVSPTTIPNGGANYYAVFATASGGGGGAPTAYTAGNEGIYVLAIYVSDTWYALPATPTVNSGKIDGAKITVSNTDGVDYVTSANASGFEWTIANATNGQTISDGSKYIYHSNGGSSGTNLTYGNGTTYTWTIESEQNGLTFKGTNGTTVESRGLLASGTTFGGYSLSNEDASGYYRIHVLPIGGGTTYSAYSTSCEACTNNVTVNYTAAPAGGTVTVTKGGNAVTSGSTVKTCTSTDLSVTITPAPHYTLTGFTATGLTTGTATISPVVAETLPKTTETTFVVTVSEGATGTLNLTPTFTEDAHVAINWNVNGVNQVIAATEGLTWVYLGGDITALPSEPSVPAGCSGTKVFAGWSTKHSDATEQEASWYDDLFTIAGPTGITSAQTYYAVFATSSTNPLAGQTMWAEDFGGFSDGDVPNTSYGSTHDGTTVYNSGSVTYACTNGTSDTKVYGSNNYAGGTAPEILVGKKTGVFAVTNIPTGGQTELTLTYKCNKGTSDFTVTSATGTVTVGDASNDGNTYTRKITISQSPSATNSFALSFNMTADANARLDDIHLVVPGSGTMTDYVTLCAPSWTITYDKNTSDPVTNLPSPTSVLQSTGSGTLSATKPTRATYTFGGWATTADGAKVYDAGDAITGVTADKTLYAVWTKTPVEEINLNYFALEKYVDDDAVTLAVTSVIPDGADMSVTWSSSNPSVAPVEAATGVVSFSAVGTATITATSTVTGTTTAVCNVTVRNKPTATFVDLIHNGNGTDLSTYNLQNVAGTSIVFPTLSNTEPGAETCEDQHYIFVGWTTSDNNDDPQDHLVTSDALENDVNKTFYAIWADGVEGSSYTQLTSNSFETAPTKYVIGVNSSGTMYYFNSCAKTGENNSWGYTTKDPTNNPPIQFTLSGTASELIATSTEATARYIVPLTTANFKMSTSSQTLTLNADGTIHNTGDNNAYALRGNSTNLRWYSNNTGNPAYFYKVEAGSAVSYRTSCCADPLAAPSVTATNTAYTVTLTWNAVAGATGYEVSWNNGAWTAATSPVNKTSLTASTTYTYKVRATYNEAVHCGARVASGNVTTDDVYSVTYSGGTGTGSCSPTGSVAAVTYEAGATVTLAATNSFSLTSNTFAAWVVKDAENNDVAVSNNQFTMPASNVTVTATWTAVQDKYYDRMHQSTDASHGGIADGNGKYYIVREGCNYTVPSPADDSTGDTDCHTTHFKLLGWIAQSHLKSDGSIKDDEESHLFQGGTIKSATGATYYAIYAIMTE